MLPEPALRAIQMLMASVREVVLNRGNPPVQYTGHRLDACTILCPGPSVPSWEYHQLESRMREIRTSGSEGGGGVSRSLPLSGHEFHP